MNRKIGWLLSAMVLSACSNQLPSPQVQNNSDAGEQEEKQDRDKHGQKWSVSIEPGIKKSNLPATRDMKMAGFDAATYVRMKCDEDRFSIYRDQICEIFSKYDQSGAVTGYVIVTDASFMRRSWIYTDGMTTLPGDRSQPCDLSGSIEFADWINPDNYEGSFSAFDINQNYHHKTTVKRVSKNIRLTKVPSSNGLTPCLGGDTMDDVYTLIGKAERVVDPSLWPDPAGNTKEAE